MPSLTVIDREGAETTLQCEPGISVMEAIRGAGFDELLAICGGCCSCATCHVYVADTDVDKLSPRTEDEDDLLDSSEHRKPNSRLSCQLRTDAIPDGLKVTIAPED